MGIATDETDLPPGFDDLLPFRDWWELNTQAERYLKRQTSSLEALRQFYDAITPRLSAIFALLDPLAPGTLSGSEGRLFRLTLGLAEVAQSVELFHQPTVPHMRSPHHVAMRTIDAEGTIL